MSRMLHALQRLQTSSPPRRAGALPEIDALVPDLALPPVITPSTSSAERPIATRRNPSPLEVQVQRSEQNAQLRSQYAQLLDNILHRLPHRAPVSILLVGVEHQVTTVGHVGVMLAHHSPRRVTLVDAAEKAPSLTEAFNLSSEQGLRDALSANNPWNQCLVEAATPRLAVMPRGQAEYRSTGSMDELYDLLAQLKREYHYVLIDAGTSASSLVPMLGPLCDATFLLIGLGMTDTEQAAHAVDQLRTHGSRLLGCVVTR